MTEKDYAIPGTVICRNAVVEDARRIARKGKTDAISDRVIQNEVDKAMASLKAQLSNKIREKNNK